MKNCVCIIGARKGSTRLPGKNRPPLRGKPLYQMAIDTALLSGTFSSIVFSTDDEEILDGLQGQQGIIIDERPASLADDKASMLDIMVYLMDKHEATVGSAESLCLLTPCHPFLSAAHVSAAGEMFLESEATSLISVTEYPCPPELSITVQGNAVRRQWDGLVRKGEFSKKYYPNGAISFVRASHFRQHREMYTDKTVAFELPWPYSLDIDYESDYALARKIAECIL